MTPLPALTLSVGVTGHRLNKLDGAEVDRLRREVRRLFTALRRGIAEIQGKADGAGNEPPTLQVLSPLAEGADRIVAETALEQDAQLVALLPFARKDYLRDFESAASRAEFLGLLKRAAEVVELSGPGETRRERQAAYSKIGAMVVERSDVLIALWDGEEAEGTGGTAEIVRLAQHGQRPVFWLPTAGDGRGDRPTAPRLLLAGETTRDNAAEAFVAVAKSILAKQWSSPAEGSVKGT